MLWADIPLRQRRINTFYLAATNNQKCPQWFFLH